jgi:hypothetical protein
MGPSCEDLKTLWIDIVRAELERVENHPLGLAINDGKTTRAQRAVATANEVILAFHAMCLSLKTE